jgi:hypothetical protein
MNEITELTDEIIFNAVHDSALRFTVFSYSQFLQIIVKSL